MLDEPGSQLALAVGSSPFSQNEAGCLRAGPPPAWDETAAIIGKEFWFCVLRFC